MTDTIDKGAALTAFQPGDEVMVRAVVERPIEGGLSYVLTINGDHGWHLPGSFLKPLPTAPAQMSAAAEVHDDYRTHHHDWRVACEIAKGVAQADEDKAYWQHQIDTLDRLAAAHLESTSAPKPPPTEVEGIRAPRMDAEDLKILADLIALKVGWKS